MSFWVIDTEGNPDLREIAIVNSGGQLVYHGFCQEQRPDHPQPRPLHQIVSEVTALIQGGCLVFHHADHDLAVLKRAYRQVNQIWPGNPVVCTVELAKQVLPDQASYGLEHLSKSLGLTLASQYFHRELAHDASYDARFTYQLYQRLIRQQLRREGHPNPFASNRVDHPFQHHLDQLGIFAGEYELLKSVLQDIRQDLNHQGRGVVITGEPGSGKTHLIMRMAQQLLQRYRLLFIRQPTHPETVFHHIYSRTLESLVQPVDGDHTQLDYLLANSFVHILETYRNNQRDDTLLRDLRSNPLLLFQKLGAAGTDRRRRQWQLIEKYVLRWWSETYFLTGSTESILKGIVKYCSYSDGNRRDLVIRWLSGAELDGEQLVKIGLPPSIGVLSLAEFSVEAMRIIGKLSILDEPLIIVFDQLEALGLPQNQTILIHLGEALKELFTHMDNSLFIVNLFPERWQHFRTVFDGSIIDRISQYQIDLQRPSEEQLRGLLEQRLSGSEIDLEALFSQEDLQDILSQASIRAVIGRASAYYRHHINQAPLPLMTQSLTAADIPSRLHRLENEVADLKHSLQILLTQSAPSDLSTAPRETIILPPDPQQGILEDLNAYLAETEQTLVLNYEWPTIITDQDDIGKLRRIIAALETLEPLEVSLLRFGKRVLPEHLYLPDRQQVIGFLQSSGSAFTARLKNFNELICGHPEVQFLLLRDVRQPEVSGKVTLEEVRRLNGASNGQWVALDKADRLFLELLAQMILDIQNRDLDIDLSLALKTFIRQRDHWLLKLIVAPHLIGTSGSSRSRS